MQEYCPEGSHVQPPEIDAIQRGIGSERIFQAMCTKCDEFHNLHVDLGAQRGLIPREEAALGIAEGTAREIAILSRVGKPVSFKVLAIDHHGIAILSRAAAQAEARNHFLRTLTPGDILPAVIQNNTQYGAFCDIGCGFPALMHIDRCCVSRLRSSADLFRAGQAVYAAVLAIDRDIGRIDLTGRELLGTWQENADQFRPGQTVPGTVRSVMPYGVFIELTPNLSGLAEADESLSVGDHVSVFIRSIHYGRHKIKLSVLEKLPPQPGPQVPEYSISDGHLNKWEYYPGSSAVTVF